MKTDKARNLEIKLRQSRWQLAPNGAIRPKELLFRFVQRDSFLSYKQTVIGPFWIFLQPLLITLVYFFFDVEGYCESNAWYGKWIGYVRFNFNVVLHEKLNTL